nr:hypothetical protein [Allomuricauda sp.]
MRFILNICSTTFFFLSCLYGSSQKSEGPYTVISWHGKITYGVDSIPLKKFDMIKTNEVLHFSSSLDEVRVMDPLGNDTLIYPYKKATVKKGALSVLLDLFFSAVREPFSSRGDDFEVVQLFIKEGSLMNTEKLQVSQKAYTSKTPYFFSWENSKGVRQVRETKPGEETYIVLDNTLFGDALAHTQHNSYGQIGYRDKPQKAVTYFTEIYLQFSHFIEIREELNFLKKKYHEFGFDDNQTQIRLSRFIKEYYGEAITLEDFILK